MIFAHTLNPHRIMTTIDQDNLSGYVSSVCLFGQLLKLQSKGRYHNKKMRTYTTT